MRMLRNSAMFAALLVFWLALSARLDPLFVVIGVISAAVATVFAIRLVDGVMGEDERPRIKVWPLLTFHVWLLLQIPPAGLAIARVVVDQRRPPRPGVVHFRTSLQHPIARVLLANAITLVPGTMTLNIDGDCYTVHAFTPASMADLASGETQRRIARAFGEPVEEAPTLVWEPIHDEIPEEML